MGSIADLDAYVSAITNYGTTEFAYKDVYIAGTSQSANNNATKWNSYWRFSGCPGAGVAPGSVAAPTNTTAGSLGQPDPSGGRQKWLVGATFASTLPGTLMIYDRLLHISGLSGNVTTDQTVGGSLTRYTDGVGNLVFYEIYTSVGNNARNLTMNYTNQAGTSGQVSRAVQLGGPSFFLPGIFQPMLFKDASGDTGVQAVASVKLDVTTGAAGDLGINIIHPLAFIATSPMVFSTSLGAWFVGTADFASEGCVPEIKSGACIAFAFMQGMASSTLGQFVVSLNTVEA